MGITTTIIPRETDLSKSVDNKSIIFHQDKLSAISLRDTFIIPSLEKVFFSFGRRYVKLNNTYQLIGNAIPVEYSFSHSHSVSTANVYYPGTLYVARSIGSTNITPKYLFLGNDICIFSKDMSLPNGAVILSQKLLEHSSLTAITGKYIYVNADSDGGSASHTHTTSKRGYDGGSLSAITNIGSADNEIPDRIELYGFEFTGTYDPEKDPIPVGKLLFIRVGKTIPSNYELVDLGTKKGLLRFAENIDEIGLEGGSETHTHSITSSDDNERSGSDKYCYYEIGEANHMPPYIAVKLIKRIS